MLQSELDKCCGPVGPSISKKFIHHVAPMRKLLCLYATVGLVSIFWFYQTWVRTGSCRFFQRKWARFCFLLFNPQRPASPTHSCSRTKQAAPLRLAWSLHLHALFFFVFVSGAVRLIKWLNWVMRPHLEQVFVFLQVAGRHLHGFLCICSVY